MTRATITVNLSGHQPNCPLGLLLAPLITSGGGGGNGGRGRGGGGHHDGHEGGVSGGGDSSSPIYSHHTVLIGWTRPYNKLGLIQKSGQVRIGDRLVEINGVSVRQWTFEKIVRVLRCFGGGGGGGGGTGDGHGYNYGYDTSDSIQIKSLGFEVLKDYESGIGYEDRNFRVAGGNNSSMRRLYCLNTFVRSYRESTDTDTDTDTDDGDDVDANNHENLLVENQNETGEQREETPASSSPPPSSSNRKNKKKKKLQQQPVVRYEIKCNLLIRHHQGNDEEVNWSVWKRYSEFRELHDKLMTGYEWIMDRMNDGRGIRFPSKRVLGFALYGRLNETVLERRQKELEAYWTTLQSDQSSPHCQDLFDFGNPSSHRYAKDMADFLEVERYLHNTDGTGSITSHPPRVRRYASSSRDTSLERLDLSNISSNIETSTNVDPDVSVAELKLDDPSGKELGEIVVKERVNVKAAAAVASSPGSIRSTSSRTTSNASNVRKSHRSRRKMKRGPPAKPAFQRMLLDDM